MVVENVMRELNIDFSEVLMGEVVLNKKISEHKKQDLKEALEALGFELIRDRNSITIEKIKSIIIDLIQNKNSELHTNLSDLLSSELNQDYSSLSNLFSEVEGTTIEKYFIAQKIEKVKELLVYDELTLTEIAFKLNYSSVAYLSNQFKRVTGLTPGNFKKIKKSKRKPLDKV